jgi:hypothetical protein
MPKAVKIFFIPMVHNPPEAVGRVAAPKLSSRGGRAQSHGTRGSVGAHLSREAKFRVEVHVVAPELTSARIRGPGPLDTWQRWSPPQQGEVQCRGTCDSAGAHLDREARSGAVGYVAAPEPTLAEM